MSTQGISQKTIGGVAYSFHTLPASKAVEVWSAIEPHVTNPGNSLSAVSAVGGKNVMAITGKEMAGHDKEALIATMTMLSAVSKLPEEDWSMPNGARMMGRRRLSESMFAYVKVGGKAVDADTHFTGRIRTFYEVLGESMRLNFADFFSGLAEVTDSILAAAKPE